MNKWHRPDGNVFYKHRNPDASEDLIIPVDLVCNTPDEIILSNIATNSKAKSDWLSVQDANTIPALLCGSGPSLIDSLPDIRERQEKGAKVFALNNAANILDSHGITADYQVICDARPKTLHIVGPAKEHLFASQVDPKLFEAVPTARLWHLNVEENMDMEKHLPPYEGAYALVGGTASCGNVATCLAFAMGHRELHCYGYDSSHRNGEGHAAHQPINADEPYTTCEFMGTEYLTTFTMKSQSETFMRHEIALKDAGATIEVHGEGLLPDMWRWHRDTPLEEREEQKYRLMWEKPSYRVWSPGETFHDAIIETLAPEEGDSIIDFGCGPGRLTQKLSERFAVLAVDFAENCLDSGVTVPFVKANLWALPETVKGKFGVCCDVMEHIPPDRVDDVLINISRAVTAGCFFRIEYEPDVMGALIGAPLHLSVHDETYWTNKLRQYFRLVRVYGDGVFTTWR